MIPELLSIQYEKVTTSIFLNPFHSVVPFQQEKENKRYKNSGVQMRRVEN